MHLDGLGDVLEPLVPHPLETIAPAEPAHRLRTRQDLSVARRSREPRGQRGDHAARGEGPAGAAAALEARGADQGRPRVDPDVDRERIVELLLVERLGEGEQHQPRVHGPHAVGGGVAVLENRHEAVARGLVDVAARVGDAVQEAAEVPFHQGVELHGGDALGQAAIAADVHEEHGDVELLLGQLGRVGIGRDQALDRVGHELGEVVADARDLAQALIHVALAGQHGLHPGDQLALVHRLGEHVVGAVLQQLHAILHALQRGHDDHRNEPGRFALPQGPEDREPVHDRHHDVEEDQIRRVVERLLDGLSALGGADRLVAEPAEDVLQIPNDIRLVVDDEHLERVRHLSVGEFSRQPSGPAHPGRG